MVDAINSDDSAELGLTFAYRDEFLDLFYDPSDLQINSRTSCKLSVLKIENGDFILDRLYEALSDASLSYVLSRREIQDFQADPMRAMKITNDVRSRFQKPNAKNGEGGEVLLYALLETITGAPKLLSKMGLKTNNEMPIFGSDGLHLLKVDDKNYQLIFGESKMYGDLGEAISNAFLSMYNASQDRFVQDRCLVAPQLMRETVSDAQLKFIESVLTPTAGSGSSRPQQAFGVFVAFDIEVDDYPLAIHSDEEIKAEYLSRANDKMAAKIPLIRKKIHQYGFDAVPFHIFAIPFLKKMVNGEQLGAAQARVEMQRHLRFGHVPKDQDVA
ncbi:hypothetical protein CKJ80_08325 [Corynebacterium hadale]|uniref:Anti-bacteriophage protein A/HamA C-terminal domain-containing protein n=1 Tax=Corynebacterium hadale TaxID=2026255 RepID=A0AB36RKY9_9CORY|nr:DUF1837 domain-containing protein [Corynebacterium hadale]PAT09960.1 hypothetical protein CKJ80_08325 [Corynebacterium hadale]